jgi:hypothetical protein
MDRLIIASIIIAIGLVLSNGIYKPFAAGGGGSNDATGDVVSGAVNIWTGRICYMKKCND